MLSVGLKGSSQGSFQGKDSFESTDSVHPNGRVPIDRSSRGFPFLAMNRVRALGFLNKQSELSTKTFSEMTSVNRQVAPNRAREDSPGNYLTSL